jgi:hypothetical protein
MPTRLIVVLVTATLLGISGTSAPRADILCQVIAGSTRGSLKLWPDMCLPNERKVDAVALGLQEPARPADKGMLLYICPAQCAGGPKLSPNDTCPDAGGSGAHSCEPVGYLIPLR